MNRETYADMCPTVSTAMTTTFGKHHVYLGLKHGNYASGLYLQYDGSNCGVINIHMPGGDFDLLAAWLLTLGYGRGFPMPRTMSVDVVIDGRERRPTIPVKEECIATSSKAMARISGPVDDVAMRFARYINECVPGVVTFSQEIENLNSGNLIQSATILTDYHQMDGEQKKGVDALLKELGLTRKGAPVKKD